MEMTGRKYMKTSTKVLLILNSAFAVCALLFIAYLPKDVAGIVPPFVKIIIYAVAIAAFLVFAKNFNRRTTVAVVCTFILLAVFIASLAIFGTAMSGHSAADAVEKPNRYETVIS